MGLRKKFTLWYIRRGYTFDYIFDQKSPEDDRVTIARAEWVCPWWVRPLLIFFSPSVYSNEAWGKQFVEGLRKALKMEDV